jgi:hypothetical protein
MGTSKLNRRAGSWVGHLLAISRQFRDTYGHLWPDADESTRTAIGKVITERMKTTADRLRTTST